jgi:hypothetical protein
MFTHNLHSIEQNRWDFVRTNSSESPDGQTQSISSNGHQIDGFRPRIDQSLSGLLSAPGDPLTAATNRQPVNTDTSAMIDGNGHSDRGTYFDFYNVLPMRFNFQRFIEFILSI